jgi:hypothetical protein
MHILHEHSGDGASSSRSKLVLRNCSVLLAQNSGALVQQSRVSFVQSVLSRYIIFVSIARQFVLR